METQINQEEKNISQDSKESKYATGRRKRSIARVWVKKGSGSFSVDLLFLLREKMNSMSFVLLRVGGYQVKLVQ